MTVTADTLAIEDWIILAIRPEDALRLDLTVAEAEGATVDLPKACW